MKTLCSVLMGQHVFIEGAIEKAYKFLSPDKKSEVNVYKLPFISITKCFWFFLTEGSKTILLFSSIYLLKIFVLLALLEKL
jgi:hypothetical protein